MKSLWKGIRISEKSPKRSCQQTTLYCSSRSSIFCPVSASEEHINPTLCTSYMKLYFATKNKHKVEEAQAVLGEQGIQIEQLDVHYLEDKELTIHETAQRAAKELADAQNKPIIVDDTGIFFSAYQNFPGANAKLMFNSLGYEGLLTLLAGKKREAYFICCIGFCEPGKESVVFEGRLDGYITQVAFHLNEDVMPYERIFIPKKETRTLSAMTREEKNRTSHRAHALKKLAEYLKALWNPKPL